MTSLEEPTRELLSDALHELLRGTCESLKSRAIVIVGSHEVFDQVGRLDVPVEFFANPESLTESNIIESTQGHVLVLWFTGSDLSVGLTPRSIWELYHAGASILRVEVQGNYLGNSFLRKAAHDKFVSQVSLPPISSGLFCPLWVSPRTIFVAFYNRAIDEAKSLALDSQKQRPVAIMTAFNERDLIGESVEDLIEQGCDVVVLDNWSDDGGFEVVQDLRSRYPDRILQHERFPDAPTEKVAWVDILAKKEEIATQFPGRWVIHTDADEFRRGPFEHLTLAQSLECAEIYGSNRATFTVLNFRPVDDASPTPGTFRESYRHFEFPDHTSYFAQNKAWIQPNNRVDLVSTGGHVATFEGAKDFPLRFTLNHIPIRSQAHASRKISAERSNRWSEKELNDGWHSHYEGNASKSFIWMAETLEYRHATSYQQDFGFVVATPLAAFFSPFWRGRKSKMREWLDPTWLSGKLAVQDDLMSKSVARVEIMGRWLASLDPTHPSWENDPYQRELRLDSIQRDLNAIIRALVTQAMSTRRLFRSRSHLARSIMKDVFFSNNWYVNNYTDVAVSGMDPMTHYLKHGAVEGRDPCSFFSTLQYLIENPDVAASGMNPLSHYILHGASEGRVGVHRVFIG